MKSTLFILLLFSAHLRSQVLQNFADARLFNLNDTTCINVSGEWPGQETEFIDARTVKGNYSIKFVLTQQGNKVSGSTYISFNEGKSFGQMKIRGLVAGNKLYFEEYEVIQQQFEKPGVTWCLRTGELDIKTTEDKLMLQGNNYRGYAAYYYNECQALVSMQLEKPVQKSDNSQTQKIAALREQLTMQLHPNPANHEVTVSFKLVEDLPVKVDMYSLSGEHMASMINDFYKAGPHQLLFNLQNFAAGVYLIRLQAGVQNATGHLVIAR